VVIILQLKVKKKDPYNLQFHNESLKINVYLLITIIVIGKFTIALIFKHRVDTGDYFWGKRIKYEI
jgi:hypothetical protein